ncbi:MAG: hypothetical protein HY819_19970 [Acidobacteria bacterium]|nr:hypothetical protein [Acidobacteriota bacterium]
MSEKNKPDAFQEIQQEIDMFAQEVITNYLSPLQTKKISKKMIDQMASECATQIASKAVALSRKASARQASKLTDELADILSNSSWKVTPLFNEKISSLVQQITPADYERVKLGIANQVVSQVYGSIASFASALGVKFPKTPISDSAIKK